jgi:hypothetical protein
MSNMMRALVRSRPEPGIWMEVEPVREVSPNDVLIRVEARWRWGGLAVSGSRSLDGVNYII